MGMGMGFNTVNMNNMAGMGYQNPNHNRANY